MSSPHPPIVRVLLTMPRAAGDPLEPIAPVEVNLLPRDWMESRLAVCAAQLRWARAQRKPIFWIRPILFFPQSGQSIGFPWTDTWRDTRQILECISSPANGELWSDIDQGYEVTIEGRGPLLHFLSRDPDYPDETTVDLEVPRADYAAAAREELRLAPALFARLSRSAWPNPITRLLRNPLPF